MSERGDPKVCLLLGPHFIRLAANAGFTYGFFESSTKDEIPIPDDIKGVSAGGIIAASFGPWTQKIADLTLHKIKELKGKDFYGINKELEFWGVLEVLGALSPLVPWNKIERRWLRNLIKTAAVGSFVGFEGAFIRQLFICKSVFSNDNLLKLLMESIDFRGLFNSPVRIEVISADINGDPITNERVRPSSVTNFRPEDRDIRKFALGVLSSASVTGFFPTRKDDQGHFITDGGIFSAFPIDLAYSEGSDVIIVNRMRYAGQSHLDHDYSKWMSALHRSMDIVIDNYSDHVLAGYVNINRDIGQIKKMKSSLRILKDVLDDSDLGAKILIEREIVNIEKDLTQLTAHNKKFINLVVIDSDEIPEFNFRDFDTDYNVRGMNIGYDAFQKSKKDIIRAIEFSRDYMK